MTFIFLKYISPTWYFNLNPIGNNTYFPDYELLNDEEQKVIQWDENYSTIGVSKLDASYQAWNRGVIVTSPEFKLQIENIIPSAEDNYRFVRKYFHPLWSVYVLLIRLLSLKNPLNEITSFWRQRKVQRIDLCAMVIHHQKKIQEFNSGILAENPKVAVIIPTLNRYTWLSDALKDLEAQEYTNFEVIVVDQSEPFQPEFFSKFNLKIKVIQQEEKALWKARNTAIQSTDAEFLLLYDDDSRTEKDWISAHLKCLDYFQADISSGVSLSIIGAKIPKNYSFYRWSDQLDTGNAMVRRDVFRRIGLFDLQFEKQRQGDCEFGLRAYLNGFKNISNPQAKRIHLKVGEGGLRQMGSWDGWRPKSWLAPRPIPSVLYLVRKYFGRDAALYSILISVPPSLLPYKYKRNHTLILLLSFLVLPLLPFVGWQVWRSFRISTQMLQNGANIAALKH